MIRDEAPLAVLMADDDPDDRLFAEQAWEQGRVVNPLLFVEDGEQLLDFLYRRGAWSGPGRAPRPGLILLDLNMPRKDGREALREIRDDPALRQIPVVVLTTSTAHEDILSAYDLGAKSFITKPVTFEGLVKVMACLGQYWMEIVSLPSGERAVGG